MVDLGIEVVGASSDRYAAAPALAFSVQLKSSEPVHAIALRAQVRIEPQRRRYDAVEARRLVELFGETPQWGDTLKPFLWAHIDRTVPGFEGETVVELPMPCTYDFEVAAAKYMHALGDGEIPLIFFFSGTVFSRGPDRVSAELVPWNLESRYRLPVRVWRDTMATFFPNAGWLRVSTDTMHELAQFKASVALPTFDHAIRALLAAVGS